MKSPGGRQALRTCWVERRGSSGRSRRGGIAETRAESRIRRRMEVGPIEERQEGVGVGGRLRRKLRRKRRSWNPQVQANVESCEKCERGEHRTGPRNKAGRAAFLRTNQILRFSWT